ncbi:ABC transporter ATP-binding protein [Pannonibacter sp. I15F10I1]|uniref:ABC transporter ATP-binding protein n=1 Tax=Pannonibacter sp. I15F10I1 TaxID=2003580 RepID=UPI001645D02C|nr:ATP-binding cassette domain-containing protein [Pannonibacter sp. I15F10I1]
MTQAAEIALKGVAKRFGATEVLPPLDLTFTASAFTVILGPSGCGKSTLLNLIAGLEAVSGGEIEIGGRKVQDLPPRERGCAMVFQSYALYPHMTAGDNIGYPLKVAGVPRRERMTRIAEAARVVGLGDLLARRPSELSGGQRQRVAIARAIVRAPQVMLFDEPLSNLDALLRHETRAELAGLHRRIGATTVFVTHDQAEALTLADQIVVMNAGRVEQIGTPADIYHRPATRFVASFIGHPPMSLITAMGDGTWLRLGDGTPLAASTHRGAVLAGVRPEAVVLDAGGASFVPLHREDFGSHVVHFFRLPDGQTVAVQSPAGRPVPADAGLGIPEHALHLFDAETGARLVS